MTGMNNNLWYATIGYGMTAPKLDYLTCAQNARLERLRIARLLRQGHHRRVFLEEGRTQFNFPEMEIQGRTLQPYITLNILKLISTTLADLLLGQEAILTIGNPLGQEAINDLRKRCDLHPIFYGSARTASWAAEAMVEVLRWQGEVWVKEVKPDEVFPLGQRLPDGQYAAYRRYAVAEVVQGNVKQKLLLETTYEPGRITRVCYKLNGSAKTDAVDLTLWPVKMPDGSPLPPAESTGIDCNTIVWMGNEIEDDEVTCDDDGLIELQDELNAEQTQIARVIAKHADPRLAVPETKADESGNLLASHDLWFYRSKDEIPAYITWNAELAAAALADRDFTLDGLCVASELTKGLMGLDRGAAPDSAKRLRLQATKTLARVARKATFVRPFIRTVMDVAMDLMQVSMRVQVALTVDPEDTTKDLGVEVELRDGLPIDDYDQAQTIALLTGGKASMSVERAVGLQIPDPVAA